VVAGAVEGRRILAGRIAVSGTLRNCVLEATGDVQCDTIIGGSIAAGGSIAVKQIGDESGVATVLWAGHHDTLDQRSDAYRAVEKGHAATREALVRRGQALATASDDLAAREARIALQQHQLRPEIGEALRQDRAKLEAERTALAADAERARQALLRTRATRERLDGATARSSITVERIAYDGVTLRTGDRDPLVLTDPRLRFTH
jgi:uncharacterized protein (DUF342 family)